MVSSKNKIMKKLFLFLLLIINSFLYTSSIGRKRLSLNEIKRKIKSFINDTLPCAKMKEKNECQNLCRQLLTEKYNVRNIKLVDKISKKIADIYFRNTEIIAKRILNTKIQKINKNNIRFNTGVYQPYGGRNGGDDVNYDKYEESDWWDYILSAICFFC